MKTYASYNCQFTSSNCLSCTYPTDLLLLPLFLSLAYAHMTSPYFLVSAGHWWVVWQVTLLALANFTVILPTSQAVFRLREYTQPMSRLAERSTDLGLYFVCISPHHVMSLIKKFRIFRKCWISSRLSLARIDKS